MTESEMHDMVTAINDSIRKVRDHKAEHPELKKAFCVNYGSILNAYREGDLTFAEAVNELSQVGDNPRVI